MSIELFIGNRSPSLTDTIRVDGSAFNLTDSTVKMQMRLVNSSVLKVDSAATIVDAASGQVRYDWAAADVDTQGDYAAWWRVTLPSTLVQDSPEFAVSVKAHAATAITLDELRAHVETGITDDALARLLTDAVAEVENRFGTDAAQTVRVGGGYGSLRLQRPALTVTSVVERDANLVESYTLSATDYVLLNGGRTLNRLEGGSWARTSWMPLIDITYTPKPEQALRDRVVIDLVRLAVQYNALSSESIGGANGYQSSSVDYLRERERLMRAIPMSRGFSFA